MGEVSAEAHVVDWLVGLKVLDAAATTARGNGRHMFNEDASEYFAGGLVRTAERGIDEA